MVLQSYKQPTFALWEKAQLAKPIVHGDNNHIPSHSSHSSHIPILRADSVASAVYVDHDSLVSACLNSTWYSDIQIETVLSAGICVIT